MAANNDGGNINQYNSTNNSSDTISTYSNQNSQVHPQAVYLTYNSNQYPVSEPSSTPYVLPVTILNNENFVFYNNTNDHSVEIEQCKDTVPEYIVNLDGSSKDATTSGPSIATVSIQGPEKIQDIYKKYPLLNKLIVKKIYTRNLLNLSNAFRELDRLHRIEEEKRKNVRLIIKEPKRESKSITRIAGDENLKSHIYSNKPFERMPTNLFKKVAIEENSVVDCEEDNNGHVVENFIKQRCKAYVSDEINGVIQEDPKGLYSKNPILKPKVEKIVASSDAGSIYPWRNQELFKTSDVDLDEEKTFESDQDNSNDSQNAYNSSVKDLSSIYPWRRKLNENISFTEDLNSSSENFQVLQTESCQPEPSISCLEELQSDECKMKVEPTDKPRFFRTKKLGDLEMKKRTYVTRELNQLRTDKKPLTSPIKLSESPGSARKKRKILKEEEDEILGMIRNDDDIDYEEGPLRIVLSGSKPPKDLLTKEEKQVFLDFFNNSPLNELSLMPGCSAKKVEEIISLRPFVSMIDLNTKIKKSSQLNDSLIESCQEVLNMRRILSSLLLRCERLKIKFDKVFGSFLENNQLELPLDKTRSNNLITSQPICLNSNQKLTSYQMVGLNWLALLHQEKVNGILADEMGLGKTVQTIAFLAYLYEHFGDRGPHLIVVPSSTLGVWRQELSHWCPTLSVVLYHGSQEERKQIRLKIYEGKEFYFNILLTTYNISTGTMEDRAMMKRVNFHYGVFDEAHMLKNMLSNRYKNLINFKVRRRLLLTGTPIQNNLLELISLLSFVMPELFSPHIDLLKKLFHNNRKDEDNSSDSNTSEFEIKKINQTKELLKPFCLRRMKDQVLPQLSEKTVEFVNLPLLPEQQKLYSSMLEEMKNVIDKSEGGSSTSHVGFVMNLRKISNHPMLVRSHYTDNILLEIARNLLMDASHANANFEDIVEDLKFMNDFQIHITCQLYSHVLGQYGLNERLIMRSSKFQFLQSRLPELINGGHRVLIFSQFTIMLDILEAYLNINKYVYLRLDGQTPVSERQDLINKFNRDESVKVFILSTKAGGLGISLTGADIVIFHDIDFNPFNDKQAEDRCHRVGQTKNVTVIKLISSNTIEEGILSIANNKLKLDASTSSYVKSSDDKNVTAESVSKTKLPKKVKFEVDTNAMNIDDNADASLMDIEQLIKNTIS